MPNSSWLVFLLSLLYIPPPAFSGCAPPPSSVWSYIFFQEVNRLEMCAEVCAVWQSTKSTSHQGWKDQGSFYLASDILRWLVLKLCRFLPLFLFHAPGDEMNSESEPVPLFRKEPAVIELISLNTHSLSTAQNLLMWIKWMPRAADGRVAWTEHELFWVKIRFWRAALRVGIIGRCSCFGVSVCEKCMHKRCASQ